MCLCDQSKSLNDIVWERKERQTLGLELICIQGSNMRANVRGLADTCTRARHRM